MKPTFNTRIGNVDLQALINHTQKLTDSLFGLMSRGVTIQDNLRMSHQTISLVSGRAIQVKDTELGDIAGISVIGFDCTVTKTAMRRISSKVIELTVWFEGRDYEEFTILIHGK